MSLEHDKPAREADPPIVVLVEDDNQVAMLVIRLLERDGYAVTRFRDGEAAIEQLIAIRPSAVVLDLGMPGMNGYEVLKRIRQTEGATTLPVLMLTASPEESNLVKGFDFGATDYLVKPFQVAELSERLRRLRA